MIAYVKDVREREDDGPSVAANLPLYGHERCRYDDHANNDEGRYEQREPEALCDFRNFLEEVGTFDFFLRRTPGDVVGE